LSSLSGFQSVLGGISIAGGLFILYSGYESIRIKAVHITKKGEQPGSLLKGVTANFFNPHPYLFWVSVGAPTMSKASDVSMVALSAFIAGFYLSLVGSKTLLAVAVGKSSLFLSGKLYLYTLRFLGLLLTVFAFMLFRDGAKMMGLL
jgi:threonine/homoserine/homoserine lactone efflux protein